LAGYPALSHRPPAVESHETKDYLFSYLFNRPFGRATYFKSKEMLTAQITGEGT
jgi:hypothetical protein